MVTTDYGTILRGAFSATLTDYAAEALGEFVADYDLPAIVADYRDAIQAELDVQAPGVTVHGEGDLYGPHPHIDVDPRAVLEAVDFWTIAARHDRG